jgi:23S rRNA (guanosine2251-2'-O)-methyltransferase
VPARREALERLVLHATSLRIPVVEVEGGTLTSLAGFDGHQGIALVVGPRRYASVDDILALAARREEPPFVLVLDSLEDPQNVGTLLRSAEAAGVHGVLFPTHRQAPLTPAAVKASSGAVEHLLLAPVDDLAAGLADLHVRGVRVVGSEADAPLTARQTDLRGPVAIVVGSEGQGLGPAIRRRCDAFMRIPMVGAVGSLNAAVAGSILVFEAAVQRDPEGTRPRRPVEPLLVSAPDAAAVVADEGVEPAAEGATDASNAPESAGVPADVPDASVALPAPNRVRRKRPTANAAAPAEADVAEAAGVDQAGDAAERDAAAAAEADVAAEPDEPVVTDPDAEPPLLPDGPPTG